MLPLMLEARLTLRKGAKREVDRLRNIGFIAGIGVVIGLFGVMAAVLAVVFQAQSTISSLQQEPKQVQQLQATVCEVAARTSGPTPVACVSPLPTLATPPPSSGRNP